MTGQPGPTVLAGPRSGHVVLVGMMGAGKTTVGRLLAHQLRRPFLDSDAEIEARTGHTVREIFEQDGEAAFRRHETETLTALLDAPDASVIAAAGGAVLDPANRRLLRQASADGGLVVWLQAPVPVLVGRVRHGTHRPLLADDPAGTLAELSAVRAPLYAEVADLVMETDAEPAETAEAIARQVRGS